MLKAIHAQEDAESAVRMRRGLSGAAHSVEFEGGDDEVVAKMAKWSLTNAAGSWILVVP